MPLGIASGSRAGPTTSPGLLQLNSNDDSAAVAVTPAFSGRGRGRIEKVHSGESSVPLCESCARSVGHFCCAEHGDKPKAAER